MLLRILLRNIINGLINKCMKPSLNQISFLSDRLREDEVLQRHFEMERAFDKLMIIGTDNLYKYILFLHINNKRFKLNAILKQLGFEARKL